MFYKMWETYRKKIKLQLRSIYFWVSFLISWFYHRHVYFCANSIGCTYTFMVLKAFWEYWSYFECFVWNIASLKKFWLMLTLCFRTSFHNIVLGKAQQSLIFFLQQIFKLYIDAVNCVLEPITRKVKILHPLRVWNNIRWGEIAACSAVRLYFVLQWDLFYNETCSTVRLVLQRDWFHNDTCSTMTLILQWNLFYNETCSTMRLALQWDLLYSDTMIYHDAC